ncbi:hypothetical protein Hdeb2414_s0022g00614391 [Helianthus debilis subsp. tardiflorus]
MLYQMKGDNRSPSRCLQPMTNRVPATASYSDKMFQVNALDVTILENKKV